MSIGTDTGMPQQPNWAETLSFFLIGSNILFKDYAGLEKQIVDVNFSSTLIFINKF
jgi:hypothetical protein